MAFQLNGTLVTYLAIGNHLQSFGNSVIHFKDQIKPSNCTSSLTTKFYLRIEISELVSQILSGLWEMARGHIQRMNEW